MHFFQEASQISLNTLKAFLYTRKATFSCNCQNFSPVNKISWQGVFKVLIFSHPWFLGVMLLNHLLAMSCGGQHVIRNMLCLTCRHQWKPWTVYYHWRYSIVSRMLTYLIVFLSFLHRGSGKRERATRSAEGGIPPGHERNGECIRSTDLNRHSYSYHVKRCIGSVVILCWISKPLVKDLYGRSSLFCKF